MKPSSSLQALMRQRILLQMEYAAEKATFQQQTDTLGVARQVKRGDAWFPLRIGQRFYNALNQPAMEVWRTADTDITHNFEPGRSITFFRVVSAKPSATPTLHHYRFTATVSYVEGDRMVVVLPDHAVAADLAGATTPIGLQLSFDETTYKLMFEALDGVQQADNNRLAYLRELFYTEAPAARLSLPPLHLPWLNASQEEAVNEVLCAKDVAVVHGPPGTGKTTTLVEAIYETLHREIQVLVCAQSNTAVDWIAEKLVDRGVPVLRIGHPSKVNDKMLSFTYERRFEAHPDYPQLWAIRKAIRELRGQSRHHANGRHEKIARLKDRAQEIEFHIRNTLLSEARVVACTLAGSASPLLAGERYATLFIDEAAQALEAACWIPMHRVSRVVLAGDPCQLPPTAKSVAAQRGGLAVTLIERLVAHKPEVVTLLRTQYRMHEAILHFPGNWFYHGQVLSDPSVRHRSILDYDYPIEWITPSELSDDAPAACREQYVGEGFGRINRGEAALTLRVLQHYLEKIGKERVLQEHIDIGVISPYRAQVQYLRQLLRNQAFFKPYRHLISINTVDGFQGQERDIVLVSLVRSNEQGQIGFLSDLRRMNVAMTRARMKLILLGDAPTLSQHPFYRALLTYIQALRHKPIPLIDDSKTIC